MGYFIYSDVSLDIDRNIAEEQDIRFVPMEYMLGEEVFCCENLETEEKMHNFYEQLRRKVTTKTSQITPSRYMEAFEPLVKEGKALIYLALSSGLSDTYSSACLAVQNLKEEYDEVNIEVVDTLAGTGGMGLLAECAIANRQAGMTLQENAQWLRDHALDIQHWFKVEDLMYLKRGGRVSAATAIMGTALNIKPILMINKEGKLDTIDKKRGNKQAMKALAERFESSYDPTKGTTVYICCADCMNEAHKLKEMLLERHPELKIRVTMLSPIIGAHTGPDMLSLIHFGTGR
ncbi:MAG: DegV family protein [Eubacteriales bacterium]|nr:DegV family protein [Eubacteriales bacterium]